MNPNYKEYNETLSTKEAKEMDYLGNPSFHTNPVTGAKTVKIMFEDWDDWGNFQAGFAFYKWSGE